MLAAQALRLIRPDRIVVMIEETQSVIELHLKYPLTPDQIAKARSLLSPLKPVPVTVNPGDYREGVFWDSELGPMRIKTETRERMPYRQPPVKRGSNQTSI
jgi:hypothetical protein